MRVLALWANAENSPNLGVRALSSGAAVFARSLWGPNCHVEFQDFGADSSGVSFGKPALLSEALPWRESIIDARLRGFDVVLDTGAGDSFTDIYGYRRVVQMHVARRRAVALGVPIIMAPQTIGPFQGWLGKRIARQTLESSSYVMARDSVSMEASISLGRPADCVATDMVFMLERPSVEKSRDVILNVSGLLWHPGNHLVDHLEYQKSVHSTIQWLVDNGRHVTLLAHVVGAGCSLGDASARDNDVPAVVHLGEVYAKSGVDVCIPSSLGEARDVLGSARVVVGARMHACLNALSSGTPAVAIAYSRKFGPLLSDLGWRHSIDVRGHGSFDAEVIRWFERESLNPQVEADVEAVGHSARSLLATAIERARAAL